MQLKLWQKWILGSGSIVVLGSAGLFSLFVYSKQKGSQGYENNAGLPMVNDLNDFKDKLAYKVDLLDPTSLQKISEFKYDSVSNGKIDGIDAKEWIDSYLIQKGQSPILSVYAGPINFVNEYTEVFLPKDFVEYIHWYSKYVSWSPDLSSISTFRIKKGLEKLNNSLVQGTFTAKKAENKVIKFIPDSFFGEYSVSSFIKKLTKNVFDIPWIPEWMKITIEETGLTKNELKTYVKEINKLNKAKKDVGKEDEVLNLYSFEEVKIKNYPVTREVMIEGQKTQEKIYMPTFLPGGKRMKDSFDKNLTRFAKEVSDIFPQLDKNGDIEVIDGVKKALHSADKIPYLELQRAVALENWKGVDANFLKYVTTHEYGHMLTLGALRDSSVSAVSLGIPNKSISATQVGQGVNIEGLNFYLASRVPNIRAKLAKPHTKKDANGIEQWILYEDDLAKWERGGKKDQKPDIFSYLNIMFEYTADPSQPNINWKKATLDHIFPGKLDTQEPGSPIDLTRGIQDVQKALHNATDPNVKKFLFLTRDINDLRIFSESLGIPLEASWVMANFDNFIQTLLPSLETEKNGVPLAKGIDGNGEWQNAFMRLFELRNQQGVKFFSEATTQDQQNIANKITATMNLIWNERLKPKPELKQISKWEDMINIYNNYWSFGTNPNTSKELFLNLNTLAEQLGKPEEELTLEDFNGFKDFCKSIKDFNNKKEMGNEQVHEGFDSTKVSDNNRSITTANEFSRKLINEILNNPTKTSGNITYYGSDIYQNLTLNSYADVSRIWANRESYNLDSNATPGEKAAADVNERKLTFTSIGGKRYVGKHRNHYQWNNVFYVAMPSIYPLSLMNEFTPKIFNYWKDGDALFNMYDANGVQLKTTINIADFDNIDINDYKTEYQAQTTQLNLPIADAQWNTSENYAKALRDAMAKKAVQFKVNVNAASREVNTTDSTHSYLKDIDERKLKTINFNELLSILMPKFSDLTFDTNATFVLNNKIFQNEISLQSSKISTLINNPTIDETKAFGAQLYSIVYEDPYFGFEDDEMNENKFWELVVKLRTLTEAQIRKNESNRNFQKTFLNQFKTLIFDGTNVVKTTEKEVKEWYRIHISGSSKTGDVYFDKGPFVLKTMAMLAAISAQEDRNANQDVILFPKYNTPLHKSPQKIRQATEMTPIWKWLLNPKGTWNAPSVSKIRTTYLYSLAEILTRDYVMATMPILSLDNVPFRYGSQFGEIKAGTNGYDLYFNPKKYMLDSKDKIYDFVLKNDEYVLKMFDTNDSILAKVKKAMPITVQKYLLDMTSGFRSTFRDGIKLSIGETRIGYSGYELDHWLRSAINDGKPDGKNFQIYDDKGNPIEDKNIRIKSLDGKLLNNAQKNRAYAFWLYLLKSYGIGDRTVSNIWREPKRDALAMWGYMRKEDAKQVKYLRATKANGDVKYFPIRQNVDNLFYLKKQGDFESRHTLADEGFTSWTTEKFIISGKWTNSDLNIGKWHLEFVNDNKKPVLDSITGKNIFSIGSRKTITENAKSPEYAPIVLTEDENGKTIAIIKNQFGGFKEE